MSYVQSVLDEIYDKLTPTLRTKITKHFSSTKNRNPIWWATASNTLLCGQFKNDEDVRLVEDEDVSYVMITDTELLDSYPILKNTLITKISNNYITFVLTKNNEIYMSYFSHDVVKHFGKVLSLLNAKDGLYFIKVHSFVNVLAKVRKINDSISVELSQEKPKEEEVEVEKKTVTVHERNYKERAEFIQNLVIMNPNIRLVDVAKQVSEHFNISNQAARTTIYKARKRLKLKIDMTSVIRDGRLEKAKEIFDSGEYKTPEDLMRAFVKKVGYSEVRAKTLLAEFQAGKR